MSSAPSPILALPEKSFLSGENGFKLWLPIDRAAATLAPGYRSTFLLHDVYGFQHGEIASILDCALGNSKSQLHMARRALRRVLSAHAGSLGDRTKSQSKSYSRTESCSSDR